MVREGEAKFRITAQQLSHMLVNGGKISHKAAIILEGSEWALKRHFAEFGIEPTGTFSDIDDIKLDATIHSLQMVKTEILNCFPYTRFQDIN